MKFRLLAAAIATALISSLSGCAIIFSPARQYVHISSVTPGATITLNGDTVSNGRPSRVRLSKFKVYNTFTAEKEGYKPRNYCVGLDKFAPTAALAVLDVATIMVPSLLFLHKVNTGGGNTKIGGSTAILPGLVAAFFLTKDLKHPKTHRYNSNNSIPALVPYKARLADEKYMLVNSTAVDVAIADQEFLSYKRLRKYHEGNFTEGRAHSYARQNLAVDNTIFTGSLNASLKKMRFIDTSGHLFPNIDNCLYLNATIRKITFHEIRSPFNVNGQYTPDSKEPDHLFSIELAIDWDILDFYKQKQKTIRTVERSELCTVAYGSEKSEMMKAVYNAMRDNMELSVMNLRTKLAQQGSLKNTSAKQDSTVLYIARPPLTARNKDNFKLSSVVIKTDEGYCSGAVVSEDGYILTSYHATLNTRIVTVMFSDSTVEEAEVVRKNASADVALLKIKRSGLIPFVLSEETDPEVGEDVWAVGIAVSISKEASLSHGIISGVRKTNDMIMLQTDASLNAANSGGALVNDKGVAVGLVSMKLIGRGVEGMGFALSAHDVMRRLNIKYK